MEKAFATRFQDQAIWHVNKNYAFLAGHDKSLKCYRFIHDFLSLAKGLHKIVGLLAFPIYLIVTLMTLHRSNHFRYA